MATASTVARDKKTSQKAGLLARAAAAAKEATYTYEGKDRTGKIVRHLKRRCKHPSREIADGQKWHEQATASACRGGKSRQK